MLCLTFDNFGCGADFGHGQGKFPPCPFPDQVPVSEWAQYNEIGLSLGMPRFLQLLRQLGVRATFFAEGYSAVLHADEMKRWSNDGHEIAMHGWKHEIWNAITDRELEDSLVAQAAEAIRSVTGRAPVGFRPPGLKITANTDDIMERHGFRYVSQVAERSADHVAAVASVGVSYDHGELVTSRLPLLPCSDSLTDTFCVNPVSGGVFGKDDAMAAYDALYEQASAHERANPAEPWVFIAHPFVSGNRAWHGFERFLSRLVADFGPGAFRTGEEVALRHLVAEPVA